MVSGLRYTAKANWYEGGCALFQRLRQWLVGDVQDISV